ncbi:MAG: hypothetical protein WCT52_02665 [Candidatus Micrarchaeia archaeon]
MKSSKVFVKIGDKFISKRRELLIEGEEILRPKAGMPRITLDMADEGLRNSNNRYVLSQHTLFEQHNGTNYAVFQQALLSGMAQNQELWPEPIANDAKITANFASGQPILLDCAQREAAAEFIRGILGAKGVLNPLTNQPISAEHIKEGWLGGTVIAPRQFENIAGALLEIAPKMEKLLAKEFNEAYRTYLAIRHKIVEKVNGMFFSEKPADSNGNEHNHNHNHNGNGHSIHVDEEATYLANYFASNVSNRFCVSRVIGIRRQPKPSNGTLALQDGLPVVDEILEASVISDNLSLKPKVEIAREYYVFERVVLGLMTRFLMDNSEVIPKGALDSENSTSNFVFDLKFELAHSLGFSEPHLLEVSNRVKKLDIARSSCIGFYEIGSDKGLVKAADFLAAKIKSGEMDSQNKLPRGTILKIFEHENRLRSAVPSDLIYAKVLLDARKIKKDRYEAEKEEFERGRRAGTDARKGIPLVSFKEEDRELQRMFKDREVEQMVGQFASAFTEFSEARRLLEQIGAGEVASRSKYFYEFAFSVPPQESAQNQFGRGIGLPSGDAVAHIIRH